jgi:hypothetical protein
MAYKFEKSTGDIVIDGFEQGIAVSPHKGIANIQNANISTESGEVMLSFSRAQQSQANITGGTLSTTGNTLDFTSSATLHPGNWIQVTASSVSSISTGFYYVSYANNVGVVRLSTYYDPKQANELTHGTTGTLTFSTPYIMNNPIASATEPYLSGSTSQYRYYILDANSRVWVYDTANDNNSSNFFGMTWFLPDHTTVSDIAGLANPTGLGVLNGILHLFCNNSIYCKSTVDLGCINGNTATWQQFFLSSNNLLTNSIHTALTSHSLKMFYTDGNFVGSVAPNTGILTNQRNIQSYCSYTASGGVFTPSVIGGSLPLISSATSVRIPAIFFSLTDNGSSSAALPTSLSSLSGSHQTNSILVYIDKSTSAFQVYVNPTGGSAISDLTTGAIGPQFFTTYYPIVQTTAAAVITWTPQNLALPFFETAQSLAELGATLLVGCTGNVVYPWDQVQPTAQDLIPLPENNVTKLITVNNMVYIFAGARGNVYITNGSTASLALTVPDYCAGIPGSENTYVEPYFVWGDAMYLRGRVWFSILDQTSTKAGNCGGVWSFVPAQNFWIGQDTGLSLRQENQNSYGTYSGYCPVLVPAQIQTARSSQYWSAWKSDVTTPTYGIDGVNTTILNQNALIETDLIPTGTMLDKESFTEIEYKIAAPFSNGGTESISIAYRQDGTSAYVALNAVVQEGASGANLLSGYFTATFEKTQWLQLQITLNASNISPTASNTSFIRLKELRLR